jgi:hypothetical protein
MWKIPFATISIVIAQLSAAQIPEGCFRVPVSCHLRRYVFEIPASHGATNQKVGSSNLSGRTICFEIPRLSSGFRQQAPSRPGTPGLLPAC